MFGTPSAGATHVADWLLETALGTATAPEAFAGMMQRLREAGVQVDRGHIAYTTLHPLNRGAGATWTAADGLKAEGYGYDRDVERAGWYRSPIHHLIVNRADRMRRRLAGPGAMLDFPVLEDFARAGLTDYLLAAQPFESFFVPVEMETGAAPEVGSGMAASFATARPTGFTDEEVETLYWLVRPLAMVVKMADQRQIALSLAQTYIGSEAGPRVLGGAIRRGDFASTPAVVWLSDLRGSTEMSVRMPRDAFVAAINAFLDCTAGAVEAEGGETLTFIGDGALAIFPTDRMGEAGARRAALAAAARAAAALDALNETRREAGEAPLRAGLALHAGLVEYGNIGSPTRLSWSALGPVVNETARLEGMTKTLDEPLVASRAFIEGLDEAAWRPLGAHRLKGVPAPIEIFAPREAVPGAGREKEVA